MENRLARVEAALDKIVKNILPNFKTKLDAATGEVFSLQGSIDALNRRLVEVESKNQELEKRVVDLSINAPAPTAKVQQQVVTTPKRGVTTYAMYLEVMKLVEQGLEISAIAKNLGIPYSTCKNYTTWTPEQIAKKKAEAGNAPAAETVPSTPATEEYVFASPSTQTEIGEPDLNSELDNLLAD